MSARTDREGAGVKDGALPVCSVQSLPVQTATEETLNLKRMHCRSPCFCLGSSLEEKGQSATSHANDTMSYSNYVDGTTFKGQV